MTRRRMPSIAMCLTRLDGRSHGLRIFSRLDGQTRDVSFLPSPAQTYNFCFLGEGGMVAGGDAIIHNNDESLTKELILI